MDSTKQDLDKQSLLNEHLSNEEIVYLAAMLYRDANNTINHITNSLIITNPAYFNQEVLAKCLPKSVLQQCRNETVEGGDKITQAQQEVIKRRNDVISDEYNQNIIKDSDLLADNIGFYKAYINLAIANQAFGCITNSAKTDENSTATPEEKAESLQKILEFSKSGQQQYLEYLFQEQVESFVNGFSGFVIAYEKARTKFEENEALTEKQTKFSEFYQQKLAAAANPSRQQFEKMRNMLIGQLQKLVYKKYQLLSTQNPQLAEDFIASTIFNFNVFASRYVQLPDFQKDIIYDSHPAKTTDTDKKDATDDIHPAETTDANEYDCGIYFTSKTEKRLRLPYAVTKGIADAELFNQYPDLQEIASHAKFINKHQDLGILPRRNAAQEQVAAISKGLENFEGIVSAEENGKIKREAALKNKPKFVEIKDEDEKAIIDWDQFHHNAIKNIQADTYKDILIDKSLLEPELQKISQLFTPKESVNSLYENTKDRNTKDVFIELRDVKNVPAGNRNVCNSRIARIDIAEIEAQLELMHQTAEQIAIDKMQLIPVEDNPMEDREKTKLTNVTSSTESSETLQEKIKAAENRLQDYAARIDVIGQQLQELTKDLPQIQKGQKDKYAKMSNTISHIYLPALTRRIEATQALANTIPSGKIATQGLTRTKATSKVDLI